MTGEPFGDAPDAELGALLRSHLERGLDAEASLARFRAALADELTGWDVLARWARPGLAVAAAILFALGLWLRQAREVAPLLVADAVRPAGAPEVLLAADRPSGDRVLSAVLEER